MLPPAAIVPPLPVVPPLDPTPPDVGVPPFPLPPPATVPPTPVAPPGFAVLPAVAEAPPAALVPLPAAAERPPEFWTEDTLLELPPLDAELPPSAAELPPWPSDPPSLAVELLSLLVPPEPLSPPVLAELLEDVDPPRFDVALDPPLLWVEPLPDVGVPGSLLEQAAKCPQRTMEPSKHVGIIFMLSPRWSATRSP